MQLPKKTHGTSPISPVVKSTWKSVELKLMAIPVIFLLLRMWSMVNGIIMVYTDMYCWANVDFVKFIVFLAVSVFNIWGIRVCVGVCMCVCLCVCDFVYV